MKIFCKIEGHEKEEIVAFCIDSFCRNENKFVCLECMFNNHAQHSMRRIQPILETLVDSIEKNNLLEKNKIKEYEFQKIKEIMKTETELLKQHVEKCIKETFEVIFNNAKEKVKKLERQNTTIIDWDNFLNDNQSTSIENDEKISNYINNNIIDSSISVNGKDNSSPYLIIDKFNSTWNIFLKNFGKYCEILRETISENFKPQNVCSENAKSFATVKTFIIENDCSSSDSDSSFDSVNNNTFDNFNCKRKLSGMSRNFLDESFYFQWLEKTYRNIPFMYAFQKRKLNLIKINEDNYLTLCRSANKFTHEEQTRVEFYCDLNKGGRMEIGIGKDETGNQETLISNDNICFTTEGIYKGKNLLNYTRIDDKDIIAFDIFIKKSIEKENTYLIRISKNKRNLIELNINKENYFVFAGFNKIGNSVLVRDFKVITTNIVSQSSNFLHPSSNFTMSSLLDKF